MDDSFDQSRLEVQLGENAADVEKEVFLLRQEISELNSQLKVTKNYLKSALRILTGKKTKKS